MLGGSFMLIVVDKPVPKDSHNDNNLNNNTKSSNRIETNPATHAYKLHNILPNTHMSMSLLPQPPTPPLRFHVATHRPHTNAHNRTFFTHAQNVTCVAAPRLCDVAVVDRCRRHEPVPLVVEVSPVDWATTAAATTTVDQQRRLYSRRADVRARDLATVPISLPPSSSSAVVRLQRRPHRSHVAAAPQVAVAPAFVRCRNSDSAPCRAVASARRRSRDSASRRSSSRRRNAR